MAKKRSYDLYKVYGLMKYMQEMEKLQESLLNEVMKELNCAEEWMCNIDIHYNDDIISIDDVKEMCDEYFNKE